MRIPDRCAVNRSENSCPMFTAAGRYRGSISIVDAAVGNVTHAVPIGHHAVGVVPAMMMVTTIFVGPAVLLRVIVIIPLRPGINLDLDLGNADSASRREKGSRARCGGGRGGLVRRNVERGRGQSGGDERESEKFHRGLGLPSAKRLATRDSRLDALEVLLHLDGLPKRCPPGEAPFLHAFVVDASPSCAGRGWCICGVVGRGGSSKVR